VPEFDDDLVVDYFEPLVGEGEGGAVLDFHSSGFFPERWFDLVVLLRCGNTALYDRLAARGYTQKKIEENLECEILEVCAEEARESYKPEVLLELLSESEEDVQANLTTVLGFLQKWVAAH
jgi:adenylate kinase